MKQKIQFQKKTVIGLFLFLWAVVLFGCGGGGGGDTSPSRKVTITGSVQIDTGSAAFQEATCRFVDGQGIEYAREDANMLGEYTLAVPPDVEGYVACTPAAFSNLALTTYCSTKGLAAGATLEGEAVTIHSTVAAQIVAGEEPYDPTARKEELLTTMAKGQDPDLNLVTEIAATLYNAMLQNNLDLNFAGLTAGDDDGGGISGTVTIGIDGTPISDAHCEFIASDVLSPDKPVLTNAVLADFCTDGQLNRADLADIAPTVNADYWYRQQDIMAAFERVFPEGVGQSYAVTADNAGNYFLAVPANVPGYVRCTPPDQDQMVLATYVPGRPEGESLEDQDVTPATTVHALQIASKLVSVYSDEIDVVDVDVQKTKENFLDDIAGMDVQMIKENGAVTGYQLKPGTAPAESQVGLATFCATALYNILYQNPSNVDYLTALDNFFRTQVVEPAFLEDQGMAAEAARATATILGAALIQAQETLDTELGLALSTARLNITVLETPDGPPVPDVTIVHESEELRCHGCEIPTDDQGRITGVIPNITEEYNYIALRTEEGAFYIDMYHIPLAPLVTLDITLVLNPYSFLDIGSGDGDHDGYGQVTSADGRVDCGIAFGGPSPEYRFEYDEFCDPYDPYGSYKSCLYNSCRPYYPPGTSVTLTAIPTAYSTFVGWDGANCSGNSPTCTLTAGYGQTVNALFAPICEEWPYEVWPQNIAFPADGGDDDISDDFPESCGQLATSANSDWMALTDRTNNDDGTFGRHVNVEANSNPAPRTAAVMIGEYPVKLAQDGQQCTIQDYHFTPFPPTFESTGGTGTIQVRAPEHCPWQPAVDADWITITSEAAEQSGNGTVTYAVAENTGAAGRGRAITIAGTSYMILQNNTASNPPVALNIQGEGGGANRIRVFRYLNSSQGVQDFDCYINNGWFNSQCASIYKSGAKVQLVAATAPDAGWVFSNWTGSCSGQLSWCDVTMNQMQAVGARFVSSNQAELMIGRFIYNSNGLHGVSFKYDDPQIELSLGSSRAPVNYSFAVINQGVADAQNFSVGFYISSDAEITTDDVLIGNSRVHVDGLASRTEIEVSFPEGTWIPTDLAVGPAFWGLVIDEFNSVREDIETNNTYAIPVHIVPARQSPSTQLQYTKNSHPSNNKQKTNTNTGVEK